MQEKQKLIIKATGMKNNRTQLKQSVGKIAAAMLCLLLAVTSRAADRDSLINEYAARLAHKLDSLIAVNTKNDAAGMGSRNNYILRLGAGMFDAEDNTGYLRQPEIPDGNGNKVSFLGNEVNDAKMQTYETQLAALNSNCATHKSYLVLIGNIPVEFENTIEDGQWSNIGQFFDSKGDRADSLKEQYKKKLLERQGFYQKVLERVRQQIGAAGGTPLAIYNIYSYSLVAKANHRATLLNYMHMDCYGNFAERETFNAIKRINWKKFNWQSKYRSDFVESAIGLMGKNNGDYKNMGDFYGTGLSAKLEQLYNAILAKKAAGEAEQSTVLGQSDLAALLIELNEAAYGRLTMEQRIQLLKILSYGNSLNNDYEHAILYTLRTTPPASVSDLFDALKTVNPLRSDGAVILYGLVKIMEDESDTPVFGGMQPGYDNNMLTALMQALTGLHRQLPDAKKEALYTDLESNIANRRIVWDYGWSDTRALQIAAGLQPVGAMSYDVDMQKNGSLTVTWKAVDGITWYRMPGNDGDPGRPWPHFSEPATFTIANPLALVLFTNRSDLGITVPNGSTNATPGGAPEHLGEAVPAVFLQYAMRKQLNKIAEDRIGNALTAMNVLVPYTRLLNILKSAGLVQKIFAGTQLLSSAASATKLVALATPLGSDTTFNKVIGYLEMVGAVNILNIKAGTGTIKNIANTENSATTMGKFVASIEGDAKVYNKLYSMAYGATNATAEQKAAAQMLIHVKDELKFKGETVFGKEYWKQFNYLMQAADAGSNTRILNLFNKTGLYTTEVTNATDGLFKVLTKNGNKLLAEVDAGGVAQLKENTALANGLTDVDVVKVKFKRLNAATVEEDILVCANKADGSSCMIAGYCFTAGTPVAVPGGSKDIATLKEGDTVITKNVPAGKNILQRISAVTRRTTTKLVRLITQNDTIVTTPEHPFYVEQKGWTLAGKLSKGARIATLSGAMMALNMVQAFDSTATVYNFEVPGTHNYYVGKSGLLAHNTEGCKRLTALMASKLGANYDEMELIIKDIATRYKTLGNLSEEAALAKLEQLCSDAILKEQLKGFLDKVKANTGIRDKFVADIVKTESLLSSFAADGRLLEQWLAKVPLLNKVENLGAVKNWVNSLDKAEDIALINKLNTLDAEYLGKLNGDLTHSVWGNEIRSLVRENPDELLSVWKRLKDEPAYCWELGKEGGNPWAKWSKREFFINVTTKGKKFETEVCLLAFKNRQSQKYLELKTKVQSDFGKNLDDYDMYSQVQLKYSGDDYFIADQLFVKRNALGDIDDMIVIENKLSSTTPLTTPQTGAFAKTTFKVRSASIESATTPGKFINSGQSLIFSNSRQWYKVHDGLNGDVISGITKMN